MYNNFFPVRQSITLIDTCSLLQLPASEIYLRKLKASGGKVIVLWAVIDELRRKIRDKDQDLSERAQKIFNLIFDYEARGVVTIGLRDDKDSRNFADNIFLGAVFKYGLRNDITVITQDKKLAEDLLSAKNSKSVSGLNITVKKLESDGTISEFFPPVLQENITPSINSYDTLELPASQILQDFAANKESCMKMCRNKCMIFSGKVVRTHKEDNEFITELLSDDENFRGRIICRFQGASGQEANSFERGQSVRISGSLRNIDTDFGDIELSGCVLSSGISTAKNLFPLRVTSITTAKIRLTQLPETGNRVKSLDGREYILSGIIARGTKSIVYETESGGKTCGLAAKIYNPDFCTIRQLEKLRLIVSLGLKFKGICFPSDILLNERGEFCGCIMPKAEGGSIEELFCTALEFANRFPDWKKTDMIILTQNVLDRIKYLHDNGIIIGNLVPENIMFNSTEDIYFIDADSWQYRDFPCPDGDVYSTPPELQGKDFNTFLRTIGNENFAVASLVFRLIMQGYPPYASFERELPEEEIRAGKFPYTVGEFKPIKDYKAPYMEARRIWSYVVRQLKDTFMHTFHENGEHCTEKTRYSVDQWIKDVGYYYACLPKMIKTDPASDDVFPKDVRKNLK